MRILCRALVVGSLLLASAQAIADVTLVRADSVDMEPATLNQHRYEAAIKKMDQDSSQITGQLLSRNRGMNANAAADSGMKVTLIKIHR